VFIRELIQNAHDSILRRRAVDGAADGAIDIECAAGRKTLVVRDDGLGMDRDEIEGYLSVIGRSGTRDARIAGTIGQFGIGFLSAFLVADTVEVVTRKHGQATGWRWLNTGRREYDLAPCDDARPGTEVRIRVKGPENQAEIAPDAVRDAIRRYADMLSVPVRLNGKVVNRMTMPWEGDEEQPAKWEACLRWVEETFGDKAIEVIPVVSSTPKVNGLLYISAARFLEAGSHARLRTYVNRMFICEDRDALRPKWAYFVGGAIDSPDLTPTAGREDVRRDEAAEAVMQVVADAVIGHFEHLAKTDPERLSAICRRHDVGLKCTCHTVPELFPLLAHLLPWRVNDGSSLDTDWRTLPEIADAAPRQDGKAVLACFTTRDLANQNFQLANAAGLKVIDASRIFEVELLARYAGEIAPDTRLVRVDEEDGWDIFGRPSTAERNRFVPLAEVMARLISERVGIRATVDVRNFAPVDLPALVRRMPLSIGVRKALDILDDVTATEDARDLARAVLEEAGRDSIVVVVNAANPLVRQLAAENLADPEVRLVIETLFEAVALASAEAIGPQQASQFRAGLYRLLERHLAMLSAQRLGPVSGRGLN